MAAPGITIVAVTKTATVQQTSELYSAGCRVFGENRVRELLSKYEALPKDIEWHMIGHLQTNKVKHIAPFIHLIQSADSPKLLDEINRQATRFGRIINCLLQISIAEEETKSGMDPADAEHLVISGEIQKWKNISVRGLMGMATNTPDREKVREEFRTLHQLYLKLQKSNFTDPSFKILSMGMTQDWKIAADEGSTMVRIGSAIFAGD
ncbi:MAG: YggS family pyridoxal phosphate-dependent enzyme [Bacteroidetes bacterium]|nr:YggS family pyridoxal phosphate-dependent enzyme [Bacteroidota bacterium]